MARRSDDIGRHDGWDALIGMAAALLAVGAAFAIGGVHSATQVTLSAAALLLTVVYVISRGQRGIRVVPFVGVFGAFVVLDLLQLAPLPSGLVHLLSPMAWETRAAVGERSFLPLTLDVPATLLALVRAFACLGLFVAVAGVCRSRRVAQRILTVLALFGAVEAITVLIHRAVGAKAIYGVYSPHSTSGLGVFGSFVNSNHTAAALTVGAFAATGLALERRGRARVVFIICAVLAASVVVASGLRGGALGLAAGVFLLASVLLVRAKGLLQGLVFALAILGSFSAAALWAGEGLRSRILSPSSRELVENQKTRGWRDGAKMALDYRWTGVGRGAFEAPLRAYRSDDESVRLVYPESFVVQSAAEWGLVATLALFVMALAAARKTLTGHGGLEAPALGAFAAAVAVVVHELADFSTEFPGVALPATVALGVAVGWAVRRESERRRVGTAVCGTAIALWALAIVLAGRAVPHTLDADDLRLHDRVAARSATPDELNAAIARHPADDYLELLAADTSLLAHDPAAMHHLNRALVLHPANAQAHMLAARLLAGLGRRPQAAIEYRLAEQNGQYLEDRDLVRLLGNAVAGAVAQEPAALSKLAERMLFIGHVEEADLCWARALDVADVREPVLAARARALLGLHDPARLTAAATALLREARSASSFTAAAQAFVDAGAPAAALQAVDKGLSANPGDAEMVIAGAHVRLAAGRADAAMALLTSSDEGSFTLAQRRDAQQLLAEIADKTGDVERAVLARARARLLERQIHAITSSSDR